MDFTPDSLPIENEYLKLVRDNISNKIGADGLSPKTRVLAEDEFLKFLLKKMIEESVELEHSLQKGNMEEELADVFEIIYAI